MSTHDTSQALMHFSFFLFLLVTTKTTGFVLFSYAMYTPIMTS